MHGRLVRWLAAVVAALAVGAAGSCHVPPNYETNSYYMARNAPADAVGLGCNNGNKSGRMSLFFGAPTVVGGTYGTTAWGAPDMRVQDVQRTVQEFIRGYVFCRANRAFVLQVGVGTSNSSVNGRTDAWLRAHGASWAAAVRDLAAWANRYYPGVAQVYGAWNVEPSWSAVNKADVWMHGYDATAGRRAMFVNAAADGCSWTRADNSACNNGWTQSALWHLAWQIDPALPIPQIYLTDGRQASQWKFIDLWGTVARGDGIYFYGAMAQSGACAQVGGCAGTNNTPHAAHDQLLWAVNTDARTAQRELPSMTNIFWNS